MAQVHRSEGASPPTFLTDREPPLIALTPHATARSARRSCCVAVRLGAGTKAPNRVCAARLARMLWSRRSRSVLNASDDLI